MPYSRQGRRFFRAQITLEALIIMSIAIFLLAISAFSVSRVQKAEGSLFERSELKMQLDEISQMSDEICIMGAGNSRAVPLSPAKFNISAAQGGKLIEISQGEWKAVAKTVCQNSIISDAPFENEIYLWHEPPSTVVISSKQHE